MAIAGILMFGDDVAAEVTSSIFLTQGYSHTLSICIVVFIAIIPLTKIPLKWVSTYGIISIAKGDSSARPIFVTVEILCGLDVRGIPPLSSAMGLPAYTRGLLRCTIRIITCLVIILIAIFIPSFDTIMAFLGSALTFTICIILPLSFYLRIFGSEISVMERSLDLVLIVVCSAMALVGTIWVFLPKDLIGAD